VHRDGYGFVTPARPLGGAEGDIFIPARAARSAMNGDRVQIALRKLHRDGRAEGEVVRILERAHETVVGTFRVRSKTNFVEPYDGRLPDWIEIPAGMEQPPRGRSADRIGTKAIEISGPEDLDGMIVNAEIVEFPTRNHRAVGRVIEVLGRPDDFGIDVEIVIRKHNIPHRFSPDVLDQAKTSPSEVTEGEAAGRRDFRDLDIVTIDGETARDFDDAVWVDRLGNGNFSLQVHIADVSHYVRPGTPIDLAAAERGNSVYFPDRAVPMLPVELSTGICSLNPGVDRLAMSALLEIDHRGEVVSQEFCRGVVRSVERMTYTNVHRLLAGDAGLRERYGKLTSRFETMRELAEILNRRRTERGAMDFDLPEPLIEFDEFGEMTGVARSPRNEAHRIIEEFMLVANEAVASHLTEAGLDLLYRIHEPPDPKKVIEFEEIASQFGASLGIRGLRAKRGSRSSGQDSRGDQAIPGNLRITSRYYQKLISRIEGKPEERILAYLMLRSLRQAQYSEENTGHFALAADCYTHFTSPIRRYPDLVVHRVLGAWLDGLGPPYVPAKLEKLAENSSLAERRAEAAERELVEGKKLRFMADRVGEEFTSLIINTQEFGFFVELEDLFVEGIVPIESLPGDRYGFDERTRRIIGFRKRRQFAVGDRLRVRLDRADAAERRLFFSVLDKPNAKPRKQ